MGSSFSLNYLLVPKNNQWLKRTILVFAFIFFDYISTLIFCRIPAEEANLYARFFMESLGIPVGLALFVFVVNLPIYMVLSFDSHIISVPPKMAFITEFFVDMAFAWFIGGLHFNGGCSWFWQAPDLMRQAIGAFLYLFLAFIFVKPYKR